MQQEDARTAPMTPPMAANALFRSLCRARSSVTGIGFRIDTVVQSRTIQPVVATGSRVKIVAGHKNEFSRGSLAKRAGVNLETVRYYEKIGLMPEPMRSTGGHRVYNTAQLRRLSFIKRCRDLGFTLQVTRELLELVDRGDYTCAEVRDRTTRHLEDVNTKIRDLSIIQATLQKMVAKCNGGRAPECPIVDDLLVDQSPQNGHKE
jgi:MerR family mercuric resistance operon transcriptional regulator